jgi:hypothetical protein
MITKAELDSIFDFSDRVFITYQDITILKGQDSLDLYPLKVNFMNSVKNLIRDYNRFSEDQIHLLDSFTLLTFKQMGTVFITHFKEFEELLQKPLEYNF